MGVERTCAVSIVLVAFLASSSLAAAQTYQGGVRGTIRDASGVVADASVQLVDANTMLTRATVSNAIGQYVFSNVLPGEYTLRASVDGYKRYQRTGIRVSTQTFLTLDVALEVGNLSETVIVEAEAPRVDRTTASISTLIDGATLRRVPSAGRNIFYMTGATATVLPTGDSQFVRQQDQSNSSLISIGGGPRRNNSYVLDGVPIVDILNRATFIPTMEGVEEIRMQVSAYDAEVGRTSGGVFNVTGKSGSNTWHGSALYENRPEWGQGRLFFARKNDIANPDSYFHLYGGAVGGPIVKNRTFFWTSTEGYRTKTARSTVLVLPTEAERRGDFSASGVTIYDPLTTRPDPANPSRFIRDPFPGNQIPASRLNPVAQALLKYVPMPTSGKSRPAVAGIDDRADQVTGKVTHRWTDTVTSTGMYAWYQSMEPDARFYGQPLFKNPADPGDGALVRQVHLVALNHVWTPNDRSVVEARQGSNHFLDDNRPGPFDPAALGFDPAFLAAMPLRKFPGIGVTDYGRGGSLVGDRDQGIAKYYSQDVSATYTTLLSRHTVKAGGDYRMNGVRFHNRGGSGGYNFDRGFTFGPDPNAPVSRTGDAFASFLLGFPSSGGISAGTPIDVYQRYSSVFAEDDVRVTTKLTVNLGLRYEYEQGLRERDDHMVVGWAFDRPFPIAVPGARPDGTPLNLTGGLVYAGVDGAPHHQGNPSPTQFAPRAGVAYALDDRTAIRAGYGLFWAPTQGISADEFGSGTPGYNQSTSYVATSGNPFVPCPTCTLTNPFPRGVQQPPGNTAGRLTGVGGSVAFVDPASRLGHLHRYSFDVQRELPKGLAAGVGYIGARGDDLAGGISGGPININQLDPKYFGLGTTLQEPVPNPFFGTALGVGILAGPTVPRGQLLRPYPQFDYVYITRSNVSRSRYNALVTTLERRLSAGWAVRADYTWSRTEDSQYSESNFFAGGSALMNNYDVDREFGRSVLDTPHRVNATATIVVPGGVTVTGVGYYQSGFPITISQSPNNSNLFGSGQRPNVVLGVNARVGDGDRDAYDRTCNCIRWLNPAAWSQADAFTFGNAPRADTRARTRARRNVDLAVEKSHRAGGSTLSLRAEVINLFDVADLRGPSVVFGDASFGQIREAGGFPRMLQLLARLAW